MMTYQAKPNDRLWGAVRVWAWAFIASAALGAAAFGYRVALLARIPGEAAMTELDYLSDHVAGAEAEIWTTAGASLLYFATFLVCAFLVLKWYLRSVRNARALFRGVETSPAWAIWWFVIPFVSLWKPYGMTSELWRSSAEPERWKGLRDPALLRWWWGAVLASNFVVAASNIMGRSASTASHLLIADATLVAAYAIQIAAGLLFLRIGGPISRRQTQLIASGWTPPVPGAPAWAA